MGECEHDWVRFSPPKEKQFRCGKCDTLGFMRSPPGKGRRPKIKLYKCRVKGCNQDVVERRYSSGSSSFNMHNGCEDHPVKRAKA